VRRAATRHQLTQRPAQRGLAPALLALAGAVALPLALPLPALAGLASYDMSGKGVLEARMALGDAENAFVFIPTELTFEQGRVYKLTLTNPSKVEHYFTCVACCVACAPAAAAGSSRACNAAFAELRRIRRRARDFASKVFTILVEAGGVEVKGAVTEVALEPGASLTWVFVPMRPGRYPLLCPVTGHVEAGMVGSLVIAPAGGK
jgi:uncharacterized cupredoxin-like copper-binding protein